MCKQHVGCPAATWLQPLCIEYRSLLRSDKGSPRRLHVEICHVSSKPRVHVLGCYCCLLIALATRYRYQIWDCGHHQRILILSSNQSRFRLCSDYYCQLEPSVPCIAFRHRRPSRVTYHPGWCPVLPGAAIPKPSPTRAFPLPSRTEIMENNKLLLGTFHALPNY